MKLTPQIINRFNVYRSGKKLIGITGEVALPKITNLTDSLEGAGVGGNLEIPVIGLTDNMEIEIPFASLIDDIFYMLDPTESVDISLNGSIQGTDSENGKVGFVPLSIIMRGIVKDFSPGTVKAGGKMGSSVLLTLSYYKIVLNKETKLEIDKFNGVYVVNGKDILKAVRDMC